MRALSGIQATGSIHLGNYVGAVKLWVEAQAKYEENFYFVPDLHTLNVRPKPEELTEGIYEAVAVLLAAGIDPTKSVVYTQSSIPANSELFNILNNYVTMGELKRMTQFKEKQQKFGGEGAVVGLFEYPVLMAADIILYDVDVVPVGDDQRQHVELARDVAERFNNAHGDTFKLPKAEVPKSGARVMNLSDPTRKMSKSDQDAAGCIFLSDSPDQIKQKISRAVTDSGSEVKADRQNKPGITNLLEIFSVLGGQSIAVLEGRYRGKSYGELKADLSELIINVLKPLQTKQSQLLQDKGQILEVLRAGKAKAEPIAQAKLAEVKQKIGLLTP